MADSVFSAPSLQLNDFLAAFGLDRADIKAIDISQDSGSLIISLELNIKEHKNFQIMLVFSLSEKFSKLSKNVR